MRYLRSSRAGGPWIAGAVLGMLSAALPAAAQIGVQVNGTPVQFYDARPMQMGSRIFIPLRNVAEALNAEVTWDAGTRSVVGHRENKSFTLPVGSNRAFVDGRAMMMDAPARIMGGRTLVPLRFAAEALGAEVDWLASQRLVAITLPGEQVAGDRVEVTRVVIPAETVVRVELDDDLSSETARVGDRFTATVHDSDRSRFPAGTRFEGRVTQAQSATRSKPGILDMAFDRAVLPDGTAVAISGSLASLDKESVRQAADGRLTTRKGDSDKFDWKWVGYGAGAGAILGGILGDDDWLKGALLGGLGGAAYSYITRGKNRGKDYHEVSLAQGTDMGVLIKQRVAFNDRGL